MNATQSYLFGKKFSPATEHNSTPDLTYFTFSMTILQTATSLNTQQETA